MLDSIARNSYQRFCVDPILSLRFILRHYPNTYTALACLMGLAVIPLLYFEWSWLAIASLLLSGFFDTLDGSLARRIGRTSQIGAVFDIISDRVVEFAVVVALFLVAPQDRGLHLILMLGSFYLCVTSFLVVGIFTQNESAKSFHYSPGLIERAETFLFFILMILFPSYFIFLSSLLSALVFFTSLLRVFQFVRARS